ncbi:hypothetical protein K501DRAFT_310673 [Backusella circina FSU 941]|nr:hypothetical protein K501DRAFT_310673 [Backusella circina FSU 941]
MQYAKYGLYNFVQEKKILLGEDFEERDEQLTSLVYFFLTLKGLLKETMKTIAVLKSQHEEKKKCYDSENNSRVILLSDIICPRIFKLSFNTHGQCFAKEHFKSSPERDY